MITVDANNIINVVIERLNNVRKDKKVSMAEIARKTGYAESSLQRVFSGESKNVSLAIIFAITRALEADISDIFKDSELSQVVTAKEKEAEKAYNEVEVVKDIVNSETRPMNNCKDCEIVKLYKEQVAVKDKWILRFFTCIVVGIALIILILAFDIFNHDVNNAQDVLNQIINIRKQL